MITFCGMIASERAPFHTCAKSVLHAWAMGALHTGAKSIALFLLCSLPIAAESRIDSADLSYNSPVARGSLLTARYSGALSVRNFALSLLEKSGKEIESTIGFRYRDDNGALEWVALLGIPSTLAPGEYTLEYILSGFVFKERVAVNLEVGDRQFSRQVIPLDALLTSIRTEPDPQKVLQTQKYVEIINNVDTNAVFSTDVLAIPVKSSRLTSNFGARRIYKYSDGSEGYAVHNGIDYAAPTGTAVHAAAAGRVKMAEERIVTGNTIVIEHLPGVMTVYFHLDSMDVSENVIVERGEEIGTVGNTGLSTGPHLHWELRVGGSAIDPRPYLTRPLLLSRNER